MSIPDIIPRIAADLEDRLTPDPTPAAVGAIPVSEAGDWRIEGGVSWEFEDGADA